MIQFRPVFFAFLTLFAAFEAWAQSAVYFCPDTTYYGYCYKGADADQCALNKCQEAGGSNCKQIVNCVKIGYGAISIGKNAEGISVIGTSCGFGDLNGAKKEALNQCTKYGGVNCKVANTWNG